MTELVIHDGSRSQLERVFASSAQALLVSGPAGIGLSTIVKHFAARGGSHVTMVLPEKDDTVNLATGVIGVDQIRTLYELTRTTPPGGRTVCIDYAERMGVSAQNAFLKLLEEPPAGTRFVLATHSPDTLLPTILSRTQPIRIQRVSTEQSEALLEKLGVADAERKAQLLFIAAGLPAELTRLVKDPTYFEHRAKIVRDARQLILGTPYERVLVAKDYKDDRANSLTLLEDGMKIVRQALEKQGAESALSVLNRLQTCHERITQMGNIRLQLYALAVL